MITGIFANVSLDFPVGLFMFLTGGSAFLLFVFLLIIVLEAWILSRFGCHPRKRAFAVSTIMNLVSSILGYIVTKFTVQFNFTDSVAPVDFFSAYAYTEPAVISERYFSAESQLPGIPAVLLLWFIFLVISILSEGIVLQKLSRDIARQQIWFMTCVANAASYLIWLGIMLGQSEIWFLISNTSGLGTFCFFSGFYGMYLFGGIILVSAIYALYYLIKTGNSDQQSVIH